MPSDFFDQFHQRCQDCFIIFKAICRKCFCASVRWCQE